MCFSFCIASLVGIHIGVARSAVRLKISGITAGIKMYKLITKKKRKKSDIIVLLTKTKPNSMEILIFRVLSDSLY